ncbi:hypothetical protein MPTK1_8g17450 [Marchantia polymorpha subsp. ruderalis]|uniref:Uncharacterized protein n=1 Tax=Marchantia polymorpha TaxID=3197 RepID=A0A2R6X8B1_MARPO|nr:hypothetical protein MARPO_0030s0079 [Marchantia polymorpha]BBN20224.1 hypothetical protein Mp_8g17450 [Marchantia polymorpha subsp. ruderalis]|eukprot:PTQ42342.1 hypothetical protein MARPO_0030s0079 [Marchantia polymorpha]
MARWKSVFREKTCLGCALIWPQRKQVVIAFALIAKRARQGKQGGHDEKQRLSPADQGHAVVWNQCAHHHPATMSRSK